MSAVGSGRTAEPTIYDVARLAGVSASAVSRALNKPGRLNLETERRIRDAATHLGYRGNPMARSLQTGRTGNISLIVSDPTNPVYFDLIRGAERATGQSGLTMVFADLQERVEEERDVAARLSRITDGLILAGSRLSDEEIRGLADTRPVVTINRAVEGVPAAVADIRPGIETALDTLSEAGHRAITYAAGPTASWMNARRREALRDGCASRGLRLCEIATENPTIQGGYDALTAVLAQGNPARRDIQRPAGVRPSQGGERTGRLDTGVTERDRVRRHLRRRHHRPSSLDDPQPGRRARGGGRAPAHRADRRRGKRTRPRSRDRLHRTRDHRPGATVGAGPQGSAYLATGCDRPAAPPRGAGRRRPDRRCGRAQERIAARSAAPQTLPGPPSVDAAPLRTRELSP